MDIVIALAICSTILGALALQAVVSIAEAANGRRGTHVADGSTVRIDP